MNHNCLESIYLISMSVQDFRFKIIIVLSKTFLYVSFIISTS